MWCARKKAGASAAACSGRRYRRRMTAPALPRVWWFPSAPGLTLTGDKRWTYCPFDLDDQPRLTDVDPQLSWLADWPPVTEWALDNGDAAPVRPTTDEGLRGALDGLRPPTALATLAAQPDLQAKIRSYTGCYLDLGDKAVPVESGGVLLHFLSDQQWVRHWLVLLDAGAPELVMSSSLPIGFTLSEDLEASVESQAIPDVVRLDDTLDLSVCADSLEQFLYRYWIENEIAFRTSNHEMLPEPFLTYAARLHS
jgi:hypothetical protein